MSKWVVETGIEVIFGGCYGGRIIGANVVAFGVVCSSATGVIDVSM